MKFDVTVVQHKTATIQVEAESEDEARELAEEQANVFPDWDYIEPCYETDSVEGPYDFSENA